MRDRDFFLLLILGVLLFSAGLATFIVWLATL